MNKDKQIATTARRARGPAVLSIGLALTVLAAVIALTTLQLREGIRRQIASRDAEALYAVALMHYAEDVEQGLVGPVEAVGDQLGIVLKSAQLRGVLGVRLFDAQGNFIESFPPDVMENVLASEYLPQLNQRRPVCSFHPRVQLWELFYPDEQVLDSKPIPLLEVIVPLHAADKPIAGLAQFLVEGHSIAAEYERLDRRLTWQAVAAFAGGGTIITLALTWGFRRLDRAHQLLAERTANLARANQELVLAAKTSALGAVTAHLIHGLKNPLAGLESFVSSRPAAPDQEADWEAAVATTRRMQAMIAQVVGVLREDQTGTAYDVTLAELEQMVRCRVQALAGERGVVFSALIRAEGILPNRVANLVALILINLTENAIQATPQGRAVALEITRREGQLIFEVRDQGPGFPADTPLFQPCRSTREGGTGIGLALCKQLANHLGAELQLASSTPTGCVFALNLPLRVIALKPGAEMARP
jgi:signal transduction histidine kinase